MDTQGKPPDWLLAPARAVLDDLHGTHPIGGLTIVASRAEGLNGLSLGIAESCPQADALPQLLDDLDPNDSTVGGGGTLVLRPSTGAVLFVRIAEILQDELADSAEGWGQARPPCPGHSHPALPAARDDEAWWICPRTRRPIHRIGRGELSA